jgi:hypothetical protein
MRRLLVAVYLCVAVVVFAPVASASAAEETVSCALEGTATFTPSLKFAPKKEVVYSFKSEGKANKCVREKGEVVKAKATVEGKGELGCEKGKSEADGTGTLKLGGEAGKTFKFKFTALATEVEFETTGEVKVEKPKGHASFAGDTEGVSKCSANEPVESLEFTASATGKVEV